MKIGSLNKKTKAKFDVAVQLSKTSIRSKTFSNNPERFQDLLNLHEPGHPVSMEPIAAPLRSFVLDKIVLAELPKYCLGGRDN